MDVSGGYSLCWFFFLGQVRKHMLFFVPYFFSKKTPRPLGV
jgi:hypothetical protein